MHIVRIPKTDNLHTEFIVIKWLKKEGQRVDAREALAEVEGSLTFYGGETSQMQFVLPSETTGVLLNIYVREGNRVPPGAGIACVGLLGDDIPQPNNEPYLDPDPEEEPVPLRSWDHPGPAPTPEEVAASDVRFMRWMRPVLVVLMVIAVIAVVYVILHPTPGTLESLAYAACYFSLMALVFWNKKKRRHYSRTLEIILFWLLLSCVAAQALLHFLFQVG